MMSLMAIMLFVGNVEEISPAARDAATKIVDAVAYKIGTNGPASCEITATSGYALIDYSTCKNAVACAVQNRNEEKRATCIATKREKLIGAVAKMVVKNKLR